MSAKESSASDEFPVVGIGASAGGLEALKLLVAAVPAKSGMAFVFVQHISPLHESALPAILTLLSQIPVTEIRDQVRLEPDHFYLIPSGSMLTATDGILKLEPRNEANSRIRIIDRFFSSLGIAHQSFAVGIILSGTQNDGSLGLGVIKAQGGLTFAQDPASAGQPEMPANAVKAGVVDFVLPPAQIIEKLLGINHSFSPGIPELPAPDDKESDDEVYRSILSVLRSRRGVDFNYYKQPTLKRRIARRMALSNCENPGDYVARVRENKSELDLLYNDLLISVTGFFRDTRTFDILCSQLLPALVAQKPSDEPLRIWVAGCASGEEAYSILMCLMEVLGEKVSGLKIQLFATDISERAIAKARIGIYRKEDLEGVSPARLTQFFTKLDGDYQINKSVREICVFAQHNFLKDPPFSRMDLVSCRNVLIYLEPLLQKKALVTFHYALKGKGFLVLGKSETIGTNTDLFKQMAAGERMYSRVGQAGRFMHVASPRREEMFQQADRPPVPDGKANDIFHKADEAILAKYSLPGVLINEQYDIVQFRGITDPWIALAPGRASFNLLRMARAGLAFELRNLLHLARQKNVPMKKSGIQMGVNDREQYAAIEVFPLLDVPEPHYLVMFSNEDPVAVQSREAGLTGVRQGQDARDGRIRLLEKQLLQIREDMRAITEEQEAANEELQSANEELLSGSEELQTLNEEMETSKEELQSTNEELTSVNHELVDRNEQLTNARRYAETIVRTIRDPLLVLDRQGVIKTISEGFYKKFGLSEKETEGKSLFEIGAGEWNVNGLRALLEKELPQKGEVSDFEMRQTVSGTGEMRTLVLNARMDRINGQDFILLAIEDISDRKKLEETMAALQKANANLEYSNQELEQFAHVASHDLQEPLRKIMTFSHFIDEKEQESPGEIKTYLQKITQAARRMERLIKDLLTFSKVGERSTDFAPVDLNAIVAEMLNDFELTLEEKSVRLQVDPLPVVNGISLHMHQLFNNLISNALKFTHPGRVPVVRISAKRMDEYRLTEHPRLRKGRVYFDITIEDNGIGFDEAFSEKIFIIFQRLHSFSHVPGTGIGLALCRRIVHNHGGEIFAHSVEGEGSVFHVILPVYSSP